MLHCTYPNCTNGLIHADSRKTGICRNCALRIMSSHIDPIRDFADMRMEELTSARMERGQWIPAPLRN